VGEEFGGETADREWLAALFAEFSLPLTRYAVRRVGEAAAGDVVSEVFLVAWRRLADIPRQRPGGWLFATAANVCQHELRGTRRRTTLHDRAAEAESSEEVDDDHASGVADRLLVHEILSQLDERDQETLRLAVWDQLDANEAATVLGCSVTAFKVRLHRARRRFAARLADAQAGDSRDGGNDAEYVSRLLALSPATDEGGTC
jgi:RNA polymerase sigma-70 factor, ECF subfamily